MTPDEAARVRAEAWPAWLRKQHDVAPYLTACPCSMCGHCSRGNHEQCATSRPAARAVPVTWIFGPAGTAAPHAAVYELHHAHSAWCTCLRGGHGGALTPRQDDLLDMLEAMGA